MLLRFVASNFLSIADEIDFNMFPAPKLKTHKNHVYKTEQVDVLKAAAIYGANGSGKSNVVLAMECLKEIITESRLFWFENINFKLNKSYEKIPNHFEVEVKIDNRFFSYGISILGFEIIEEWLFELNNIEKEKSTMVFERTYVNGKTRLKMHDDFLKTPKDKLRIELYEEEILEVNEPFLAFANDKFEIIKKVYQWFETNLQIILPETEYLILQESNNNKNLLSFINEVFPKLDTGVDGIQIRKITLKDYADNKDEFEEMRREFLKEMKYEETEMIYQNGDKNVLISKENNQLWVYTLNTKHKDELGQEVLFDLDFESDGTQRLLDLLPFFEVINNQETTLIIDEIGRSIHPAILKRLIELIMKSETKGQIIFTTHESQLLDLNIFRSDEIWFTEKDKFGKTSIYPLSDFKPRYDLNIQKGYLNGRFGAIPFLGDLKQLKLEESHAEEK